MSDYVELKLVGGETVKLDREDYDKLPFKNDWRLINPKGKPTVIRYTNIKTSSNYRTLVKTIFTFHSQKQMIVFLNGDRFDMRRNNMSFPRRNSAEAYNSRPDMTAYRERKKMVDEINVGPCIIGPSKKFRRPDPCLKCTIYAKCLDTVCEKTEWDNWEIRRVNQKSA